MIVRSSLSARTLLGMSVILSVVLLWTGCFTSSRRNASEAITQALEEKKTKTDNLRNAMRYLKQMNPLNRDQAAKEVQLELNTWLATADRTNVQYSPSDLLRELPEDLLQAVGSRNPLELEFTFWDIDYLYQSRIASLLASWIVEFPIRDDLMQPILDKYAANLSESDSLKLYNAYRLFDWTIRNIALETDGASVEDMTADPRPPIADDGRGYGYLPWQVMLFSSGDFIERGRVFCTLARQQGIDTVWISADSARTKRGNLWTIGVVIADQILLFEPKLGMPILEPDKFELATLNDTLNNPRIMRRLDLAGQFDYALDTTDLSWLRLLIDAPPVAGSARMKMLEQQLLSDERMNIYVDFDGLAERLKAIAPDQSIALWQTPLLAQVQAIAVRERMKNPSPYSMSYMMAHGVWLLENYASAGRRKHLVGEFENTLDADGALKLYMESRIDNERIDKLPYDPDVQKALGLPRMAGEDMEQFSMRIQQAQIILGQSKVDAAFLLAQLHFDRGNYSACINWLEKENRVLDDERGQKWWPAGYYLLARAYEQTGQIDKAAEALTYERTPQQAGNRLRLRYLRREKE